MNLPLQQKVKHNIHGSEHPEKYKGKNQVGHMGVCILHIIL
jgi:hypothetical protein